MIKIMILGMVGGIFGGLLPYAFIVAADEVPERIRTYFVRKNVRAYLQKLNSGTLSDNEANNFYKKHCSDIVRFTPGNLKCCPSCPADRIRIAHHLHWKG